MTDTELNPIPKTESERVSRVLLSTMLIAIFIALYLGGMLYVITSDQLRELYRMRSIAMAVSERYPEKWNTSEVFENSMNAIYETLDRYSGYAPADIFHQIDEETTGEYSGLGVTIARHDAGLMISSVNPEGPAQEASMRLGDVIIATDTISLRGLSTLESTKLLRGTPGDTLHLTVIRPSGHVTLKQSKTGQPSSGAYQYDTLEVNVVRRNVPLQHVTYAGITDSGALFFRISDFDAGMFNQFKTAFDSLSKMHPAYSGVIIDLRGNPGGLMHEALDLADFFMDDGVLILGQKGRSRFSRWEHHATGKDETAGAPVVIMTSHGSASGSEVFAGALKYADRARIVGDTTFGKGLVQSYFQFQDGSASRLTIARYYFSGEVYLNDPQALQKDSGAGIPPDVYIEPEQSTTFIRQLRSSLLFYEAAARWQDEIISAYESGDHEMVLREFAQLVAISGMKYESPTLASARDLLFWIRLHENNDRAIQLAREIVNIADSSEDDVYATESAQIIRHLAFYAFERRDGLRAAYGHVELKHDDAIARAQMELKNAPTASGAQASAQ